MMESLGPRQIVPSGPAASLPAIQAGEKVVHRPEKKVLPTEKAERMAQTGPKPTFQYTYLEQVAALWPEEPPPPVSQIAYEDEGSSAAADLPEEEVALAVSPLHERAAILPEADGGPVLDIRR